MSMNQDEWNKTTTMDQALAGLTDMARMMAAYHEALCETGLPDDVVASLLLDYHRALLRRILYPTAPLDDAQL